MLGVSFQFRLWGSDTGMGMGMGMAVGITHRKMKGKWGQRNRAAVEEETTGRWAFQGQDRRGEERTGQPRSVPREDESHSIPSVLACLLRLEIIKYFCVTLYFFDLNIYHPP